MKERIQLIMQEQAMKQRDFAAAIGISASSLSSLLNGHTSPTTYTVQAIHRRFPKIRLEWLMFGEGPMLVDDSAEDDSNGHGDDAAAAVSSVSAPSHDGVGLNGGTSVPVVASASTSAPSESLPQGQLVIREIVKYVDKPQRRITEILVHYDDGTFETFPARKDV